MSTKKIKIDGIEYDVQEGLLSNIAEKEKDSREFLQISSGKQPNPLQIGDRFFGNTTQGKDYPGRLNHFTMRTMARHSTIVRAIINLRAQQIAKMPIKIVPIEKEPPRRIDLLKYSVNDLQNHPAFDESDKVFIQDIFERIDPDDSLGDKRKKFLELKDKGEFQTEELSALQYMREKHDAFYAKREKDTKKIKKVLSSPDPYFTDTHTWNQFLLKILDDILILDRGTFVKLRNGENEIEGLMPVDGSTLKPVINEFGFIDPEKAYVQVVDGLDHKFTSKRNTVIMMMNPKTDIRMFGYGESPIETLYSVMLTDLFIDKGNLDYYRKGGSIPEGMLAIEPPSGKDGVQMQISQEQLESFQRQLQSIMMGDFTQIPIVTGGKVEWIDFKGSRRDMQFKELAEYVAKKICMVYQVSPQDIGLVDGIKQSDSETQAELTKSKGLKTLMTLISEYITVHVIKELRPENDLKLWFDEEDIEDEKNKWDIMNQKLQQGVLSINQARAELGLHPVPWGNTPLSALTKNWQAPVEGGGAPGLPPLPGLPAPPPGAAPGGDASMMPPPDAAMKSVIFGDFMGTIHDSTDYSSFVTSYYKSSTLVDQFSLNELVNYDSAFYTNNVVDTIKALSNEFEVPIEYAQSPKKDDYIVPSYLDGNGIVVDYNKGSDSILRSMAAHIYNNSDIKDHFDPQKGIEAVERYLVGRCDAKLKAFYEEIVYKHKLFVTTIKDVEKVAGLLNEKPL